MNLLSQNLEDSGTLLSYIFYELVIHNLLDSRYPRNKLLKLMIALSQGPDVVEFHGKLNQTSNWGSPEGHMNHICDVTCHTRQLITQIIINWSHLLKFE